MITIYKTNTYLDASKYVLDVLSRVDQSNLSVTHTIIVPDRASLEAERALLSRVKGSFNIQVRTFRRLASDVLTVGNYLSKQAGVMVLSGLVADNRDKLVCYTKGVDTAGFVESMYDTISMMKYCKIAPNKLLCDNLPRSVSGKAHDIGVLYQAYCDYTDGVFVDSADKLDLLAQAMPTSSQVTQSYFYIYDFDNLSAQELTLVEQLVKCSKGVTVACCVSNDYKDKYLYLNDIYTSVLNVCKQAGVTPNVIQGGSFANRYVKHIGNNLFRFATQDKIATDGFVQVASSVTRAQEVYALACKVQQYVRSGGRFRDVFVVTSDVDKYANAVSTIFSQFDIPYFCDRQYVLADHPYCRFVVDYLLLCKNNAKLNYVLPFVKNYLFCGNFDDALAQDDDVFQFENYCLKYNVSYNFNKFNLGKEEQFFAQADRFRQKFVNLYNQVKVPFSASVSQYVDCVNNLIQASNLSSKNDAFCLQQQSQGLHYDANVTSQVQQQMQDVLTSAQKLLGDRHVKLEDFVKTLVAGLTSCKISVIPVYNDCVIFANMAKARKHDVKFLALLGANYGVLPIVKSDTKLLLDSNIQDLCNAGINVEPQILLENKREKFSLFQLLQEPTQRLYVSYAQTDGVNTLVASPFVQELCSLFVDGNGNDLAPSSQEDEQAYTAKQAIAKVVRNKRRILDGQCVNMPSFEVLSKQFERETNAFYRQVDGKSISVTRGTELYLKNDFTSVTQLTEFYECPYKFFCRYGLNVQQRPVAQLKTADLGTILHDVMEHYVKRLDLAETDEQTNAKADECFEVAMSNDFYRAMYNDAQMKGTICQLRHEAEHMCRVIKEQFSMSQFTNMATELEFGKDVPAVEVNFDGGKFKLKGKIDRVDVCNDKFIVIDYKSGQTAADYKELELYRGHKMQLLVYLKAVMNAYHLSPAGFYYFNMHNKFVEASKSDEYAYNGRTLNDYEVICQLDKKIVTEGKSVKLGIKVKKGGELASSRTLMTKEQFDNQIEYAFRLIAKAGELMSKGYAAINPYKGACEYCDYKSICDFDDTINYAPRQVTESVDKQDVDDTIYNLNKEKNTGINQTNQDDNS